MEIKTLDISFCNKNALNLVNKEAKQFVMDKLKTYGIDLKHKYANIINKRTLRFLSLQPHLVSVKTNGSNYFLLFTRINEINTCLFIDRKVKQGYTFPRIISVKYCFDNSIFNDTLVDGELIKDNDDNWMFLIGDLILFEGNNMSNTDIVNKYNTLYEILTNSYNETNEVDICPIRIKKLFSYKDYGILLTQFIPSLSYKVRGLYFNTLNPKHSNHLFLYSDNIKDKKTLSVRERSAGTNNTPNPKQDIKSDQFEIRKADDDSLYEVFKNGESNGIAHISKLSINKKIINYFRNNGDTPLFMSCKYNEKFSKWEPI